MSSSARPPPIRALRELERLSGSRGVFLGDLRASRGACNTGGPRSAVVAEPPCVTAPMRCLFRLIHRHTIPSAFFALLSLLVLPMLGLKCGVPAGLTFGISLTGAFIVAVMSDIIGGRDAQEPAAARTGVENNSAITPTLKQTRINWERLDAEWPKDTVARLRRMVQALQPFEKHFRPLADDLDPINEVFWLGGRSRANAERQAPRMRYALTATAALDREELLHQAANRALSDPSSRAYAAAILNAFLVDERISVCTNVNLIGVLNLVRQWSHAPSPTSDSTMENETNPLMAQAQRMAAWCRGALDDAQNISAQNTSSSTTTIPMSALEASSTITVAVGTGLRREETAPPQAGSTDAKGVHHDGAVAPLVGRPFL